MRARLLCLVLGLPVSFAMAAPVCTGENLVRSTPYVVSVVELYTSEGCDSCPPAERWLGKFSASPHARQPAIPMAFHVDYWDYLGWLDPFAQAQFSERQRALTRRSGRRSVYTPQVFVNEREVGSWHDRRAIPEAISAQGTAAKIDITLGLQVSGNTLRLSAITARAAGVQGETQSTLSIAFALTEGALQSAVTAGENRGSTLQHEHVVRYLAPPVPLDTQGSASANIQLGRGWKRDRLQAIAIVRDGSNHLQAVSAPLCAG